MWTRMDRCQTLSSSSLPYYSAFTSYGHCTALLKISMGLVPSPGKSDSKVRLGRATMEVGLRCSVKQENSERARWQNWMQSPKVLYNCAPNLISTSLYITFGEEEGVWWGERAAWVSKCPCNRAGWAQPLAGTIVVPPYSTRNTVTRQQASLSRPHLQATAVNEWLSVVWLSYWPAPQWALPTGEGPLQKWLRQGWVLWWSSGREWGKRQIQAFS